MFWMSSGLMITKNGMKLNQNLPRLPYRSCDPVNSAMAGKERCRTVIGHWLFIYSSLTRIGSHDIVIAHYRIGFRSR